MLTVPRLDRDSAADILANHRDKPPAEISALLPIETVDLTHPTIGGQQITRDELVSLRAELIEIAEAHGMPDRMRESAVYEGRAATALRRLLPISPHEASEEGVWSNLTCCWLLDIAVWRFGGDASDDRFIGHINRNTFRRMWWRAEILGSAVDLALLGEDELVNIMERPTLFSDPRLAQAIAAEFLRRVQSQEVNDRMRLMREGTKRILRLTPFLSFTSLDTQDLSLVVADAFDTAVAGIYGATMAMPARPGKVREESDGLEELVRLTSDGLSDDDGRRTTDLDEVAHAALDIAERVGRVTNATLRDAAPVTTQQARAVFQLLLDQGRLVRRGKKRGTHYVLADEASADRVKLAEEAAEGCGKVDRSSSDSALRRLLRKADK